MNDKFRINFFLGGKGNDEGGSENPDSLKGRKKERRRTNLMVTFLLFLFLEK